MTHSPVRKAVFPVAGLGTRFLPATKVMAKEMLPIVDKPLIQYAMEECAAAGIEEFIFVTGPGKGDLENHFRPAQELEQVLRDRGKQAELDMLAAIPQGGDKLKVAFQPAPLGLGHAVWCAKEIVGDEPFAVVLPDELFLAEKSVMAQMVDTYNTVGGNVVGVMEVPREQTSRYGILDVSEDDGRIATVQGLVEKPDPAEAPSTLSIIGRYILQPEVFTELEAHETGAGGEIQLTDAMAKLIGRQPFAGLRPEGKRYDCGSKLGFLQANVAFALARHDGVADGLEDWLKEL
ncbi:MAG: UTP--glucose-1-phosphate uridylyltransferase [Alphaproteobacteria bacterium]